MPRGGAWRVGPEETDGTSKRQFHKHFCNVCAAGPGVGLAGVCCFPCLKAQTLYEIDGSDRLFSFCCVSQVMARNYVRAVYEIEARRPGWECLGATLLPCCANIQQYAHVRAHEKPELPPLDDKFKTSRQQRAGCSRSDSTCDDPVNVCCQAFFSWSESAMLASALLGMPFWVSYLCSNFCTTHHFLRKNYGVPGSDIYEDCLEPSCCCACCLCTLVCCPELCCPCSLCPAAYFAQQRDNERAVVRKAGGGSPTLLRNGRALEYSDLFEALHPTAINPVILGQPEFTDTSL